MDLILCPECGVFKAKLKKLDKTHAYIEKYLRACLEYTQTFMDVTVSKAKRIQWQNTTLITKDRLDYVNDCIRLEKTRYNIHISNHI